jgi:mevalonate kinase
MPPVFGLASSTALTVLVIPAIYVWLRDDGRQALIPAEASQSSPQQHPSWETLPWSTA